MNGYSLMQSRSLASGNGMRRSSATRSSGSHARLEVSLANFQGRSAPYRVGSPAGSPTELFQLAFTGQPVVGFMNRFEVSPNSLAVPIDPYRVCIAFEPL